MKVIRQAHVTCECGGASACSLHLHDRGRCILAGTQDGEHLLLRPASSEAYALWVLSLNAAVACAATMAVGSDPVINIPWML